MELSTQELGMEYAILFSEPPAKSFFGDNEMCYFTENMIAFELCDLKACCNKTQAEGLDDLIWF